MKHILYFFSHFKYNADTRKIKTKYQKLLYKHIKDLINLKFLFIR